MMQTFEEFWALVVDVWQQGVFGADVGHFITALGIFLAFFLLRGLVTRFILYEIKVLTARTHTPIDDDLVVALEGPVRFTFIILGLFFGGEFLRLEETPAELADNLFRSLVTFNIFWLLFRLVQPLSHLFTPLEELFSPELVEWLLKILKGLIALIGGAAVLEIWGIKVGPMLAGLGIVGAAVALGAQDLFKNLIGGMLVLAEKRFRVGDWILVDGIVEGTVEKIGFRSTMVRRFDKAPVQVPNAEFADKPVTNFSEMTHRRIYWKIGVEYGTRIDQLREIRDKIEAYVLGEDAFAKPPEVATFVRIDSFNASSIDIMLYCFTRTTVWGEWLAIKEQLAYRIKQIVEEAGTGFAFPSQSIYVESLPSAPGDPAEADQDGPEPFTPPQD